MYKYIWIMSNFIEQIKPKALQLCKQYGILPSLMIAQACHESGFGRHAPGNNLFGYKYYEGCGRDWQLLWTWECIDGQYVKVQAKFRKYNSLDESLEDYAKLIGTSKRYTPVRACKDYKCAAYQIKACGYATGHQYDKSIINVIEQYQLYELDAPMEDYNITQNFRYSEFICKDGTGVPEIYKENMEVCATELQILREELGKPIIITSAYRTPEWNKKVGGKPNSYHLRMEAVDIKVKGMKPYDLAIWAARETNFQGIGIADSFIHLDLRNNFTVFKY